MVRNDVHYFLKFDVTFFCPEGPFIRHTNALVGVYVLQTLERPLLHLRLSPSDYECFANCFLLQVSVFSTTMSEDGGKDDGE